MNRLTLLEGPVAKRRCDYSWRKQGKLPPIEEKYKGSLIVMFDRAMGHGRGMEEWRAGRYLVLDIDVDEVDRGVCGDDLDALIECVKQAIDARRGE